MAEILIYQADPGIRAEQIDALRGCLPVGWRITDSPDGATAILTENSDLDQALLEKASCARIILKIQPGAAHVAATSLPVVSLYNTGIIGVAEHVAALILALSRRLLWVSRQAAAQAWVPGKDVPILTDQKKYTYNWVGLENSGAIYSKRVGIVGLGVIGRAVAERLKPFGVRLFYTDLVRLSPAEEAALGVQWRSMDDLLRESDFVTLHLRFKEGPDGNEKMMGAREFGLMKPTAYFINTSRGRMVDEDALVAAIKSGQIAGAGLDVFEYEPLPHDHPLIHLAGDQVILTAHTAGTYNPEAWHTTAVEIVERIQEVLAE